MLLVNVFIECCKDGRRVIVAVFNSTNADLYLDSRILIDYGFDNFKCATIVDKEKYTDTKKYCLQNNMN